MYLDTTATSYCFCSLSEICHDVLISSILGPSSYTYIHLYWGLARSCETNPTGNKKIWCHLGACQNKNLEWYPYISFIWHSMICEHIACTCVDQSTLGQVASPQIGKHTSMVKNCIWNLQTSWNLWVRNRLGNNFPQNTAMLCYLWCHSWKFIFCIVSQVPYVCRWLFCFILISCLSLDANR